MNMLTSLSLTLVLIALSGVFSGLLRGLMSLNTAELRRKAKLGNPEAQLVYPLRARNHELLITLLLANLLVNSSLVILITFMLPEGREWVILSIILVSVVILIFGEIVPQAFFKRRALKLGATLAPIIDFCMRMLHPVNRPLSDFIAKHVGNDEAIFYSNEELIHILEDHVASSKKTEADELRIVRSALAYGDMLVDDIMTPRSMIEAVQQDEPVTTGLLAKLQKSGHSRIPVYGENLDDVTGVIYMHDLVGQQRPDMRAKDVAHKPANFVNDQQKLDHVLNAFIKTRHHLFVVVNEFQETVGIVTIEDILEQIIGRKIVDEFDRFDDIRAVAALKAKKRRMSRGFMGNNKKG